MNENSDELLKFVAKLYYLDDLKQSQISELVGLSVSQVSRTIKRAKEKGIVRIAIDETDPRNSDLEELLAKKFHLNHVIVIKPLSGDHQQIRRNLGYFGAPIVTNLIASNSILGLAGGRTIFELITRLNPVSGTVGVSGLPLMGNLAPTVSPVDAVELCHIISKRFMGALYSVSAPVYIPEVNLRDSLLNHPQVSSVFRMYDRLNFAIIGVGSLSESLFVSRNVWSAGEIDELHNAKAIGEICGRFYDVSGNEVKTSLRDRVIGIPLEKLQNIPDVLAVAEGINKVNSIVPAFRSGLVKSILTDEATARELMAFAG